MQVSDDRSQQVAYPLPGSLQDALQEIRYQTGNSADLGVRPLQFSSRQQGAAVFIEGLIDKTTLENAVIGPLIKVPPQLFETLLPNGGWNAGTIGQFMTAAGMVKTVATLQELFADMMSGCAVLLMDGEPAALSVNVAAGPQRGVDEPQTQSVIRGPRDGMTEDLQTNISLVRRRLRTPQLRVNVRSLGTFTHTKIAVMYINGIADDAVVREVEQRLGRIHTDSILESGYIEEYIQDRTWTPFPTMMNSERPDAVAGALLEGQVAILTDGTPFVLIVPVTFSKFMQSSEDYYQRFDIATFLRVLRYVAFWVSMLLPSLYIAITTFHQEMLPSTLLISLAAQREGIPFPAFVEVVIMEATFEVLREAGVRMPKLIGPAISIVGALVLGQAAVQAGLVSAAMVIVVSFTAISNFVTPAINMAIASRLIRFGFMIVAATLGLFGIMAGLVFLIVHLAGLTSFGVPYLTPAAPMVPSSWKDMFIRAPRWTMKQRPQAISHKNLIRQSSASNRSNGEGGAS